MVVYNSWARFLFDTRATHSFILTTFASSLGLHMEIMDCVLSVASPMGGELVISEVCKSCVVRIAG